MALGATAAGGMLATAHSKAAARHPEGTPQREDHSLLFGVGAGLVAVGVLGAGAAGLAAAAYRTRAGGAVGAAAGVAALAAGGVMVVDPPGENDGWKRATGVALLAAGAGLVSAGRGSMQFPFEAAAHSRLTLPSDPHDALNGLAGLAGVLRFMARGGG